MHKLGLIGYGKMGKLVDSLAPEFGFETVFKCSLENPEVENFSEAEVIIDFTSPETAIKTIEKCANLKINLVMGTTGWQADFGKAKILVEKSGIGFVWSPNFSIGIQVFLKIIAEAAAVLKYEMSYEAWGYEIHHSAKKDAPSGTLLKIIETMRDSGYVRSIDVASNRAGSIPGIHEIGFDSSADSITIRHTARNREGFGRGALKAAQFILGKQGFYEFKDI